MNTRFKVEWCSHLPVNNNGDAEMDEAKYSIKCFSTFNEATDFARKLLKDKKDAFGSVPIYFQTYKVDEGILENEERTIYRWYDEKVIFVEADDDFPLEKSMESVLG